MRNSRRIQYSRRQCVLVLLVFQCVYFTLVTLPCLWARVRHTTTLQKKKITHCVILLLARNVAHIFQRFALRSIEKMDMCVCSIGRSAARIRFTMDLTRPWSVSCLCVLMFICCIHSIKMLSPCSVFAFCLPPSFFCTYFKRKDIQYATAPGPL